MHYLSIAALARDIRSRAVSPVEVTHHLLDRIDSLDPQLQSYVTVTADRAIRQAKAAEAEILSGHWRGPLHGVPIAFKDIIFTDFAPTTAGTRIHRRFRPAFSATVVTRLERAGAVTLGKVKTTEQAYATHHPDVPAPLNPWDAGRWSGSSSSGSGVSVAAGLAFGALGSDTGGSIRFPSAVNGITGLKPTWGRVSRHGVFELAASLDHIGPMARSAEDAGHLLKVMAGQDRNDQTTLLAPVPDYAAQAGQSIAGLRIGLPLAYACEGIDPAIVAAWTEAASVLADMGAVLVEMEDLPLWRDAARAWLPLCAPETALAHDPYYPARKSDYGETLAALIDMAAGYSSKDVAAARQQGQAFSAQLSRIFENVDLILIPTTIWRVPVLERWAEYAEGENADFIRFAGPFDISGSPTITFPGGFDADGMPLAVQLVGPALSESRLVRAAAAFQQATDWHLRRPPLP